MMALDGMRDMEGAEILALDGLSRKLQAIFDGYGYTVLDTPLLERAEIYLRKAGGEFSSKLYSFSDPGGEKVSLRPEFTASVIRHFVSKDGKETLPLRYQYAGPVFRHEDPGEGQYRQFYQLGAELLGASSPRGDAEVLSLISQCLRQVGLVGCTVVMSHVGMMSRLCEMLQISQAAQVFLLNSLPELSRGGDSLSMVREKAIERGLLQAGRNRKPGSGVLKLLGEAEARTLIGELVQGLGQDALGQRLSAEVVEGFLQKMRGSDEDSRLERALKLASELAPIRGEPTQVLRESQKILSALGLDTSSQTPFREMLSFLDGLASVRLEVNLGLFRGIAYYSGVIFDLYAPGSAEAPLGGGGRYDGLIKALGGQSDVPALGFALTLERVLSALNKAQTGPEVDVRPTDILVIPESNETYASALKAADALRREGLVVEVEVVERPYDESLEYARGKGIKEALTVRSDKTTQRLSVAGGNR